MELHILPDPVFDGNTCYKCLWTKREIRKAKGDCKLCGGNSKHLF